jgi:GT2 family glycosyltransferase
VVCIPVYSGHEHFVRCLRSVLAHTSKDVRILICDDASPDPRSKEHVRGLDAAALERQLYYARSEHNVGFPANINRAFAAAAPADVVILNSDCIVASGWLEGMRAAAHSDSTIATATALTNHGTLVSVPERGAPSAQLPGGWNLDDAAAAVRSRSLRLHPRIPTGIGHCLYVRRTALELVGDFDLAFSPGYGEEVDFSQRCVRNGLAHVVADDVFVFHHGGASFGREGRPNPVQVEHERMLERRYPYYHGVVKAVERDASGPLARSLSATRRTLAGLNVIIDARVLAGPMTGSQVHVLELLAALSRTSVAELTAIVPANLSFEAARLLDQIPGLRQMAIPAGSRSAPIMRADVFHRPFQVSGHADLVVAAQLGERMILTQQDMIAYHNPAYFSSFDHWEGYRGLTRKALAMADRVVFMSAHARDDALSEDLIEPNRASVVHIGVDHPLALDARELRVAPPGASRLPPDVEVMLCIGTDFRHKNRLFTLRLVEQLQRRHAWPGHLVLAGPRVTEGSSSAEESQFLSLHPEVAKVTSDFAAVSDAEKRWLLERASVVLYPTVHEGFGLIPFEAAHHDVPCLWAPGTSLSEILPDQAAAIVPWDAAASAEQALGLLRNSEVKAANIAAIREAATELTWDTSAAALIEIYHATSDGAAAPASAFERRHGDMKDGISDDAMRLVGPHGALPAEMERPLLALATHPPIARPVFGAVRLGYRASYALRRRRSGTSGGRRS